MAQDGNELVKAKLILKVDRYNLILYFFQSVLLAMIAVVLIVVTVNFLYGVFWFAIATLATVSGDGQTREILELKTELTIVMLRIGAGLLLFATLLMPLLLIRIDATISKAIGKAPIL